MKEKNGSATAQNDQDLVIHLRAWEGLPDEGAAGGQAEGRTDTFSVEEMLVQRPWSRREVGALEMLNKASVGRKQRRQE